MHRFPLFIVLSIASILSGHSDASPLSSPPPQTYVELRTTISSLDFIPQAGAYGIQLKLTQGNPEFEQTAPLAVDVVDAAAHDQWLLGGYDHVEYYKGGVRCTGTLVSPNGTKFNFVDLYRSSPDAYTLTRNVSISSPSPLDKAFNTQFSIAPTGDSAMVDNDFFMPGNWYLQNAHVPASALAASLTDPAYYIREDRLPLPIVAMRDRRTGITLTLAHLNGVPSTIAADAGLDRIVDSRLQYGSLGVLNADKPSPVFLFPGTEGQRTYLRGRPGQPQEWAYRSHPVVAGAPHSYTLLLQLSHTDSYADAVRLSWRTVYKKMPPPVVKADSSKSYRDGMELLTHYCQPYYGFAGIPFAAETPSGKVVDTSSEMGFVGQALPAAALVLRYGYETGNTDAIAQAGRVVDFWSANSRTTSGVLKTWYDVHPDGSVTWRNYNMFLRTASDGMSGVLQAWNTGRHHGVDHVLWLAYCREYGDWLLAAQNADGSWAREYDFNGNVVNPAKDTTDQPIPFLADLYYATGDAKYKAGALRAGNICWQTIHTDYSYVGGTPDNPNVADKEGGMMALAAFLSLYDLTEDRRWMLAAEQAADYDFSWVYCWNIPIPGDDPSVVYPAHRNTAGLSLIATGHSGADNYMADAPFMFYRLSLLTGDPCYKEEAILLQRDTTQMTNWDASLGYAYPGLLTEALSLAPPRGHGTTHWLPWLTVGIVSPLTQLQDVFGSMDIETIDKSSPATLLAKDKAYSKNHLFLPQSTAGVLTKMSAIAM